MCLDQIKLDITKGYSMLKETRFSFEQN